MKRTRIPALDGLKGLAILAVIFTHLPLGVLYESVTKIAHPLLSIVLGSGGVGVTLFFIVTGFLMGRLYPAPQSVLSFWSRRYARLFPPFLVMVAGFTLFRLFPHMSQVNQIATILSVAVIMRWVLWLYSRISAFLPSGKWMTLAAVLLQVGVAAWYVFYLLRVPSAVFYEMWPKNTQIIITAVVNATLTLPFGQYIAQLDGIYWALAAELVFYLLYPIIYVPIFTHISRLGIRRKFFTMVSLFPFCFGLYLIGQRFLGFETLKLHLTIYFIAGVFLSSHIELWQRYTRRFRRYIESPTWHVFWLALFFGAVLLPAYIPKDYHPWIQIIMSIPTGIILLTAIDETTYTGKWFAHPVLSFFGRYSYALFLVHSFVIHILMPFVPADTAGGAIQLAVYALLGSLIAAVILYWLTEAPYYFLKRPAVDSQHTRISAFLMPVIGLVAGITGLLYITYKPPLALFTVSHRHGGLPVWTAFGDQYIPLSEQPMYQSFEASRDGLGMILVHVRNRPIPDVEWGFVPSKILIRLRTEQDEIIAQNTYNAYEIIDSRYHPIGFPVQEHSKGVRYSVEYLLSQASPARSIELVTSESQLISVYFIDKQSLIRLLPASVWFFQKLSEPFANPMFWVTLAHIIPFFSMLFFLVAGIKKPFRHRHNLPYTQNAEDRVYRQ